jgi:hypothetical protein
MSEENSLIKKQCEQETIQKIINLNIVKMSESKIIVECLKYWDL